MILARAPSLLLRAGLRHQLRVPSAQLEDLQLTLAIDQPHIAPLEGAEGEEAIPGPAPPPRWWETVSI